MLKRIKQIITVLIVISIIIGAVFAYKSYKIYQLEKLAANHPQGQDYVNQIKDSQKMLGDNNKENDFEALFQIAFNLETLGDHEGAIKNYKKALEISPKNTLAKWNLANIYKGINQKEEAEKLYKECIAIEPQNLQFYGGLGELYRGWQGKELEEPSFYLRSLEKDKENTGLMKLLAEYFRSIDDKDNLRYWLSEILRIDPDNYRIKEELDNVK